MYLPTCCPRRLTAKMAGSWAPGTNHHIAYRMRRAAIGWLAECKGVGEPQNSCAPKPFPAVCLLPRRSCALGRGARPGLRVQGEPATQSKVNRGDMPANIISLEDDVHSDPNNSQPPTASRGFWAYITCTGQSVPVNLSALQFPASLVGEALGLLRRHLRCPPR